MLKSADYSSKSQTQKKVHKQHEMYMINAKEIAFGTQRHLFSTDLRWGFVSGGNANFRVFRYQHVGIPNAKLWHLGSRPTQGPNANVIASQWNIGLTFNSELACDYTAVESTFHERFLCWVRKHGED